MSVLPDAGCRKEIPEYNRWQNRANRTRGRCSGVTKLLWLCMQGPHVSPLPRPSTLICFPGHQMEWAVTWRCFKAGSDYVWSVPTRWYREAAIVSHHPGVKVPWETRHYSLLPAEEGNVLPFPCVWGSLVSAERLTFVVMNKTFLITNLCPTGILSGDNWRWYEGQ